MRVAFYCYKVTGRGGMESVLTTVVLGLQRLGHDVRIFLEEVSEDPRWENGLPVVHCAANLPSTVSRYIASDYALGQLAALQVKIREWLPDVLVGLSPRSVATAQLSVIHLDAKPAVLSWVHFSLTKIRNSRLLDFADGHIAISDAIREQLAQVSPDVKTHLIYNPVRTSVKRIPRATTPKFLYIGRIENRQKRLDRIIKALWKVKGNWTLEIIGDGPDRDTLMVLAEQLGIAKRVTWYGWQDNPWDVVTEATCLLLASDYEGFGLVLVEALARGIPVVSSDCPTGPYEIVTDGQNGWLFESNDGKRLEKILQGIVDGTIMLPAQDACESSVAKFGEDVVIPDLASILSLYGSRTIDVH